VKPVVLVRNDAYESFGVAAPSLAWAGIDLVTANLPEGADLPPITEVAGVVMFGGTSNVDQLEAFPHLARSRDYARRALDQGVPFLGICLGCQILARALGRSVPKAAVKECGFEPIRPTAEGKEDRLLSQYTDGDRVLQWHEDTVELAPEATLLATSDAVEVQAFRVGDLAWGIQFHQEVDAAEFGWWVDLADASIDLERVWGKPADRLREEAARDMPAHEERGRELFRRFAEVVREAS
jgi:GMP synthase-like glutamine amidotransferase